MEVFQVTKVSEFIAELPKVLVDRISRTITRLEGYGNLIRFPHSRPLGQGLFELRIVGATHIRILYFFHENRAILLHAVIKKRQDLRPRDIEYALEVQNEYLASI